MKMMKNTNFGKTQIHSVLLLKSLYVWQMIVSKLCSHVKIVKSKYFASNVIQFIWKLLVCWCEDNIVKYSHHCNCWKHA